MKNLLLGLWQYRHFIKSSIYNDLVLRFARSKLGALWVIINPLTQALIFTIVLSEVLAAKLPGINNKYAYALYLLAGLLAWTTFSETINRSINLFIENGNLMKKIAFPRICLPIITTGIVAINSILLLIAILVIFILLGHSLTLNMLWLPLLLLITLLLGISLGLILGTLNVFIRDIGQIIPITLQILFWLTPIVYTLETLPEGFSNIFSYNPIYPIVASFQNVLVFNQPPIWSSLLPLIITTLLLLSSAFFLFRRAAPDMVDVL